VLVLMALYIAGFALVANAQEAGRPAGAGIGAGLLGVGAGIAIGFGAVGTGIAQSRIGGAAAGVVAERPEMFGIMLVLLVIPETLVIFGFVIAFFLYGKI
ncbi:MAG TPA: V-type ATP synthase subunit K, partial [bacterium]|nr:V-type ATP synthase subunit K [bacterium]